MRLPQLSLSAMRNLKTNPVSSRPLASHVGGTNSAESEKTANPALETQYPTIWKKAFALGQNVRFTRTPEVEILRKRVENDPDFAEKLTAFEMEQRRRRENAPQKSAGQNKTQQLNGSPDLAEAENLQILPPMKDEAVLPLQDGIGLQNTDGEQISGIIASQNQQSVSDVKSCYLSDSAFFECGPVFLDCLAEILPQNAVDPALHGPSVEKGNAILPLPSQARQPDVSIMPAKPDAMNLAKSTITDLYRVLECRFSNNHHPSAIDDKENERADEELNDVDPNNEQGVTADILQADFETSISASLSQNQPNAVEEQQSAHCVVTTFNNHGEVVVENSDEAWSEAPLPEEIDMSAQAATMPTPVLSSLRNEVQSGTSSSVEIVEDIEPQQTNVPRSSSALGQTEDPATTIDRKSAAPQQPDVSDVVEKPQTVLTKATISSPLRTLNPAFIPSPKAEHTDSYVFPSIDLLQQPVYKDGAVISQETLERSAGLLESVLEDFGIKGEIIHVRPGPVVTMYEFEPAAGVKSSRVISLSDDIARSMSAISARVAVIPGRNVIGIELPNKVRETVYLRELIQSKAFQESNYKLALTLGKNIGGEPVIAELAKMPHLLVAGTTGSGKSVAINAMILSLLYRLKPEQCRLIMVDPKMLELSIYDGIPHLLTPVVTDPKKAVTALKWAVREMEDRYRKMAKLGVRNIDGFNQRVSAAAEKGESITCRVQSGFDKETGEMLYHEEAMDLSRLPYIVVIVDEMADLMMVAGKEIEGAIQRLAQMARAAGIHLIMATQRPSVDVITGTIKANFPTRISFQVTSKIDSRTILGEQGAETLLGQGDMLHMVGGGRIVRVHGPFVSDEEVEHVVAHLKTQGTPDYLATVTDGEDEDETIEDADSIADIVAAGSAGENIEELYLQAVKVVMRDKKCSTSYIQRRLGIGYNKAATLVERMEAEGIVGPANHVGKREILLTSRHGHEGGGH